MKLRGLYAITDSQLLAGRLFSHVEAALEGGVCLLQYRDKSDDAARRLHEAEGLLTLRALRHATDHQRRRPTGRARASARTGQTDGP